MGDPSRLLILDADGVFLSERPYWNAALATALLSQSLDHRARGRWDALADYAFGPVGVQRVTKGVGCNSNWDLAAVLTRGLEEDSWRQAVDDLLASDGTELQAMQALRLAGARLCAEFFDGEDPLERFGIQRNSTYFTRVVEIFQDVLNGKAGLDWEFNPWQLKEPSDQTHETFSRLRDAGYTLRVCTGRHRVEIEYPIRELGLDGHLPSNEITSADEIDRAESESGRDSLGKPHWFGPACATIGFDAALERLEHGGRLSGRGVYVGDAWADFRAVGSCRALGLELDYVHARSGVTTRQQEKLIAGDDATLGVVSSLPELVGLLASRAA